MARNYSAAEARRGLSIAERTRLSRERYGLAMTIIAAFGRGDTLNPEKPDPETARLILSVLLPTMDAESDEACAVREVLARSPMSLGHYCRRNPEFTRELVQNARRDSQKATPRRLHAAAS